MAASRAFSNKRSRRPNILINNGIGAEVRDLRSDVEEGFIHVEAEIDLLSAGSAEVANIATLEALPAEAPPLVFVSTTKCYWMRHLDSTLTTDGITIVNAIGGGRWQRKVTTTALDWLSQAAWTIDPLLGNDENPGGALAPLSTAAELDRRLSVGAIRQHVTVTIVAGATVPNLELTIATGIYRFNVVGTPTTLASGTVDTLIERTHAGSTPQSALLTDAGVLDWTPFVGRRIRITSGAAAGSIAWGAKGSPNGLGLNVARVSRFCGPPPTSGG